MKIKYLKENFEPIVRESKNYTEILIKLGMGTKGKCRNVLKKYIELYNIDISHFETQKNRYDRTIKNIIYKKKIPLSLILISGSTYNNVSNLKERLYKEGIKERKCELCEQNENWRGVHMSLILDHINGINNDHRLENLRIVCPNCNATLPTHCKGARGLKSKLIKVKKTDLGFNLRRIERPTYQQLKEEITRLGYCGTGRKYGVSDNTIRKWIKYYEKHNVA